MITWKDVLGFVRGAQPAPPRRVEKTEREWREVLAPEVFQITRLAGTERPFSSELCSRFDPGLYACACCGTTLFDAAEKFESGSGWPSFTQPVDPAVVGHRVDQSHGMTRVENTCAVCDAHLGHVFPDGPPPHGLRYCINALSLRKITETEQL